MRHTSASIAAENSPGQRLRHCRRIAFAENPAEFLTQLLLTWHISPNRFATWAPKHPEAAGQGGNVWEQPPGLGKVAEPGEASHSGCSSAPHGGTEHSQLPACQPGDGDIGDTHGATAGTGAEQPLHASTAARRPRTPSSSGLHSKKLQAA